MQTKVKFKIPTGTTPPPCAQPLLIIRETRKRDWNATAEGVAAETRRNPPCCCCCYALFGKVMYGLGNAATSKSLSNKWAIMGLYAILLLLRHDSCWNVCWWRYMQEMNLVCCVRVQMNRRVWIIKVMCCHSWKVKIYKMLLCVESGSCAFSKSCN